MDSKDFDKVISNKIDAGEKMEDIISAFVAAANRIEAQQRKNKSNEEVKKIICGGTQALIADMVGKKIDDRALTLLILTWFYENSNFMDMLTAEDLGNLLKFETETLRASIKEADAFANVMRQVAEECEEPKENDKPQHDPFMDFWKKHGIV